jgi:SAM-dependent methyltransferase
MAHPLTYPRQHDDALAALLDPFSARRVADLVDLTGRRVLEVGAGGGSFARHLADRVGPHGHVYALDLNPRIAFTHPQLTVVTSDLTRDELPGDLDLVHARLTLNHIPERRTILTRLRRTLAPGGVLLIEDWWASNTDMVMHARTPEDIRLYHRFQHTLGRLFDAGGTDRTWARHIHGAMLTDGLADVTTVIHATAWTGGGPGCQLVKTTIGQLWDRLIATGLSHDDLVEVSELLDDPDLVLAGHPLYSTSGHRAPRQRAPELRVAGPG